MHAVFADINKLRNKQNGIGEEQTSKASKTSKPKSETVQPQSSTSIQSHVAPNGQHDVQSPDSSDYNGHDNDGGDGGMRRNSSVKKKKKKKKKTDPEALAGIEINEESVPSSSEYQRIVDEEINSRSLLRTKTQISLIADGAYPDASSLFNFQSKPPLLVFTYIFAFIASIDMMVNLPTLYSAIADSTSDTYYYVYILLVYVSAQFVSTLLIGAWLDRRPMIEILCFLTVCIILGNTLYTFGVHNHSEMQMLVGRGICGVGSCVLVIGYAHVTRYSQLASRESRIVYFRFIVALGTIIGPLIGTVVGGGSAHWSFLNIDSCNSGSFVVGCIALLFLLSLILFCVIETRRRAVHEQQRVLWGRSEEESQRIDDEYSELHHNINNYVWRPHRFCSREAFMLWCLYTSAVFTFWSFTGAIIPIGGTLGNTKLTVTGVYAVFVYVGLLYLASFGLNKVVFGYLRIRMEKRVLISLILMVIGSLMLTSFGLTDADAKNIYKWQILVAAPFLTSGFCISTITIPALYVTLVGAEVSGLGIRMSWFFSLASFGVLAGPIYGYLMWKRLESINFICHANALLLLFATLIGFVFIKIRPNGSLEPTPHARSSQDFNVEAKDSTNNLRKGLLTERL